MACETAARDALRAASDIEALRAARDIERGTLLTIAKAVDGRDVKRRSTIVTMSAGPALSVLDKIAGRFLRRRARSDNAQT